MREYHKTNTAGIREKISLRHDLPRHARGRHGSSGLFCWFFVRDKRLESCGLLVPEDRRQKTEVGIQGALQVLDGPERGLKSVGDIDFLVNVVDVGFHCVTADEERLSDVLI